MNENVLKINGGCEPKPFASQKPQARWGLNVAFLTVALGNKKTCAHQEERGKLKFFKHHCTVPL